jgi:hypothetical protein
MGDMRVVMKADKSVDLLDVKSAVYWVASMAAS